LNFLLSLDRKHILLFSVIIFIFFLIFVFFNYYSSLEKNLLSNQSIIPNVDITEPRFAINNSNQKILVSAKEGNFLDDSRILLNKNVLFKSNDFVIKTDKVIFNRLDETAISETKSTFISNNTKINSEGFNIYDNGKKIKFYGNSVIILK
tara:strand:- start:377 stop:826 length:450 start_codon:yes stop_codon:yes gene_type:complete